MTTDTMSVRIATSPRDSDFSDYQVSFDQESHAWKQIGAILRESLTRSGFPQPHVIPEDARLSPLELSTTVVVAPGIVVTTNDFQKRYQPLNLCHYRKKMSPELFKAFVRHVGRIPGRPDLDLGDVVTLPE